MSKSLIKFFIFLIISTFACLSAEPYDPSLHASIDETNYLSIFPDFDMSLKRYGESEKAYNSLLKGKNVKKNDYYKFKSKSKKLYNLRKLLPSTNLELEKIPRIIHQIWLGSPVPHKYFDLMQTWQGWEGWTYILWTDKEVADLILYNQDLYDNSKNFGERSDILRYEILKDFGGLYVDVDFACRDSAFFDFAHSQYQFYLGIEPLEHKPVSCCNAIMASAPGHVLIEKIVSNLRDNVKKHINDWAVESTGPRYISRLVYENFDDLIDHNGILFPPTFFYPIKKGETKALYKNKNRFIHPETAAIHFWEGSWMKDDALIKK